MADPIHNTTTSPGHQGVEASLSTAPLAVATARRATFVAFIGAGAMFASWVSRIPQVRSSLGLSTAQLGLVLLGVAAGSLAALPLAGVLIHRLGTRAVVSIMASVAAAAIGLIAVGYHAGVLAVVIGLFGFGFGLAGWGVAMNVQAAAVERASGRAIMPRFHASYSIGTVVSALLGAGLIAVGVPVTAHLLTVGVLAGCAVTFAARAFLPDHKNSARRRTTGTRSKRRLDRRTLLIGLIVLAFAFAEGAGNDWIGVALVDDQHTSTGLAGLGYAAFLSTMTLGRWTGTRLLDRHGRVATIRRLAAIAQAGLLLFVFSPWPALALAGVLLWGLGACLGYPVGLSAAADDPDAAASRVSVVSGIGQLAFLGGPPLIGLLGSWWNVQHALVVVPVLVALAALAARALAPTTPERPTTT